jgi:hypothetical protein
VEVSGRADGGGAYGSAVEVSGPGWSRRQSRCIRWHSVGGRDGVGGSELTSVGAKYVVVAGSTTTSGGADSAAAAGQCGAYSMWFDSVRC